MLIVEACLLKESWGVISRMSTGVAVDTTKHLFLKNGHNQCCQKVLSKSSQVLSKSIQIFEKPKTYTMPRRSTSKQSWYLKRPLKSKKYGYLLHYTDKRFSVKLNHFQSCSQSERSSLSVFGQVQTNDVCRFRSNSTTCFCHLHSIMLTRAPSIVLDIFF